MMDSPNHPITSNGVRELRWLISVWFFHKEQIHRFRLDNLVDELQRLMENDKDTYHHVSPFIEERIEEIGIMSECLKQIDLYQP